MMRNLADRFSFCYAFSLLLLVVVSSPALTFPLSNGIELWRRTIECVQAKSDALNWQPDVSRVDP